jgi:hypothetical protein
MEMFLSRQLGPITLKNQIRIFNGFFYTLALKQECKEFKKGGKFYEFRHNTRSVKSTYVHFQVPAGNSF